LVNSEKKEVVLDEGLFHQGTSPEDKSYLIGSKCKTCGNKFFPRRVICPICLKEDTIEEISLGNKGKIYSYSIARLSMPGYPAPYMLAYVDLESGPRIYSLITGCEPKEGILEVGDEVELVIGKITEDESGNHIIAYRFKPV
jgi:uncharacterized OB-fold protein